MGTVTRAVSHNGRATARRAAKRSPAELSLAPHKLHRGQVVGVRLLDHDHRHTRGHFRDRRSPTPGQLIVFGVAAALAVAVLAAVQSRGFRIRADAFHPRSACWAPPRTSCRSQWRLALALGQVELLDGWTVWAATPYVVVTIYLRTGGARLQCLRGLPRPRFVREHHHAWRRLDRRSGVEAAAGRGRRRRVDRADDSRRPSRNPPEGLNGRRSAQRRSCCTCPDLGVSRRGT